MNRLAMFVLLVGAALAGVLKADAQPATTLYSFGKGPANPRGNLAMGPDGNFYGTTENGGQSGDGTVFRVTTNGTVTTLVSFSGYPNGSWPYAGLTLGPDGNFYGTTIAGGSILISGTNNTGTVFRLTTNGTLTTLVNFTGTNGGHPQCRLTIGQDGSFYGTTAYGGASNNGTVFRVTTNGVLTTLVSFAGTNGATPEAGLALGLDGSFYGTTVYGGGTNNLGTIFRVTTNGNLTTLVTFAGKYAGDVEVFTNGISPYGQLILGTDGNLYGTTAFGGNLNGDFSGGTVFQVTTNGVLTTLIYFSAFGGTNGDSSYAQLIQGANGNFYGTTSSGGANGSGTVFQVTTNGTLAQLANLPNFQYLVVTNPQGTVYLNYTTNNWTNVLVALDLNGSINKLYDFPPLVNATNSTGADSQSGLTLGPDGNFYSATLNGGAYGYGAVIRITTNGTTTTLASFSGNTGTEIHAGLSLGPDGSLYGATQSGGVNGYGTLFKWSSGDVFSTLVNFDYWTDGANPDSSLTLGPDGNLYGTASDGGTNLVQVGPSSFNSISDGTVFRLTTNGVFTPLVYFNGTNGANPYGGLTLGGDGNIYGTTTYGGTSNSGTVFQLTTNGTLIVLTSFTGTNGANPYGGLNFGPDGNLYGMTSAGGISNVGTVFEISTQGVLNTLVNFTGTNGADPQADLVWSTDGCFYGTTYSGGSNNAGTVFKLTLGGTLTTLVNFANTNGAGPSGDLIKGSDGNLYGTTAGGGPGWSGTGFRLTTNGTLTTLVYFNSTGGYWPFSGLTLVTNGNFIHLYGTAFGGGSGGGGTIYRVNLTTAYTVAENSTNTFYPLTNEVVWTTGGTLSLVSAAATNGTAQITGSGIVFTPAANFIGTATVNYKVTDNAGGTNNSVITLLVTNVPPVANPDVYTVAENSSSNVFSPLANDQFNTSGGILGLVSVSPTNGTAVISGTNVLFTPQTNFTGTAMIGYTITDNVGGTNRNLITVQVTNAPPVANPQSVTNQENVAQNITLTGYDPNHLPLTFVIVSGPGNGTLNGLDTNTGAATYTPDTNYIGADSFTFLVNDGQTSSAPVTVSITVTAAVVSNTPPVANPDYYAMAENTTNTFSPLVNDVVQTAGGTLSLISLSPTNGTAAISGTNVIFTPFLNFQGTATIGYAITDNVGGTNSSLITVTVTNSTSIVIISPTAGQVVSNAAFTVTGTASSLASVTNVYVQLNNGGWTGAISANGWTNWTANVTLAAASNTVSAYAVDIYGNPSPTNSVIFDYVTNTPLLADLSLTASSVYPNWLKSSNDWFYSFTISNAGPGTATGVVVSNQIPTNLICGGQAFNVNFISATGGATPTNDVLLVNLGTLAVGATNLVQVIESITPVGSSAVTNDGYMTNVFQVFADQTDPEPTNNAATFLTPIVLTAFTSSTETYATNLTATVNQQATNYSTELIARLPNGTVVYDQTFSVPYSNATVQSAITTAAGDLTGAGASSYTGPTETSFLQSLEGSSSVTVTNAIGTNVTSGTTLYIGQQTILVGANQTQPFFIPAGAVDYDTLVTTVVTNLATTTDFSTNLNAAIYVMTGIVAQADLKLTASAAPEPVGVGSNLVYSISITNQGPTAASGVTASNRIPAGVTFVSATGGATPSSGVLLVNLGSLATGAVTNAQVIVQPTAAGKLTNLFQVFANETDPVLTNNSVTVVSTVTNPPPVLADLSLSASVLPEPVIVGSNLVYTIAITNRGPSAATGVVVSNRVPANETFVSTTGGSTPSGGILLVSLGSLAAGATNSAQIIVQPTIAGKLTNLFQVFASQPDPVLTNNSATVVSIVTNPPPVLADLGLSASVLPEPVIVGSNLVYTISITNRGSSAATGVVVSNQVPVGVTFVSATGGSTPSGGVLLVNLGSLAAGATNSAQIVVQPTSAGKLTNLFQVFANETDPVLTNNSAAVISTVTNGPPLPVDVALSITAAPNPVAVGAPLTYSLTVTNNSSTTATGVMVSNTLPPNVTVFSLLPSQGAATNQSGVVTYSVGSLPNGNTATLAIVVLPNVAGLLTNTAFAASTQTDSYPGNNVATNITTAVTQSITNLVLTVLSSITLNPQTGLFEQRIQVANGGPATPSSVLVTVSGLPANAKVYNAAGTTNGLPYVQSSSPLGVGSNVVFLLEYYIPTRVAPTNLTFTVEAGPTVIPPVVSGTILSVSRTLVLTNGNVLVEFSAVPGQIYAIQYSSDMVTWLTAVPVIAAPANRVQWIDAGPPQTVSSPAQTSARYYRVVLLTAH